MRSAALPGLVRIRVSHRRRFSLLEYFSEVYGHEINCEAPPFPEKNRHYKSIVTAIVSSQRYFYYNRIFTI